MKTTFTSEEKRRRFCMAVYRVEIPFRLPSLNTYINKLNYNRFAGNKFKADTERDITPYLSALPKIEKPVKIAFHWVEQNRKRDIDNISASKKFILDALVKASILTDDNRRHVTAFTDTFTYAKESKVILEIEEVEDVES